MGECGAICVLLTSMEWIAVILVLLAFTAVCGTAVMVLFSKLGKVLTK